MREHLRELVGRAAQELPVLGPVYEFGSWRPPRQDRLANLRPFFPGMPYVGCDAQEGPGVDKIMDLEGLDLPDSSVGTALCVDTLEHVRRPHLAIEEIRRVLVPGGFAFIASVMDHPIHGFPDDYWRFTPSAFRFLVSSYKDALVFDAGRSEFPHTVVAVAWKDNPPDKARFVQTVALWQAAWKDMSRSAYSRFFRRWAPPAIMPSLDRLYQRVFSGAECPFTTRVK